VIFEKFQRVTTPLGTERENELSLLIKQSIVLLKAFNPSFPGLIFIYVLTKVLFLLFIFIPVILCSLAALISIQLLPLICNNDFFNFFFLGLLKIN